MKACKHNRTEQRTMNLYCFDCGALGYTETFEIEKRIVQKHTPPIWRLPDEEATIAEKQAPYSRDLSKVQFIGLPKRKPNQIGQ